MDKLDANDKDFIFDEANLEDPPEMNATKKSNVINPLETIANINSKSNNGSSDSIMNVTVSLPCWGG